MVIQDDRTESQKTTHVLGIAGTDRFMSGWGGAEGGASVAVWACEPGLEYEVERWVRARGDMQRVRVVVLDRYRPKAAHVHIYVVTPGHAAAPHWYGTEVNPAPAR